MNQRRLLIVEEDRKTRDLLIGALGVTFAVQAVSCDPDSVVSSIAGFQPRGILFGSGPDRETELRTLLHVRRKAPDLPVTLFGPRYLPGAPLVRRALSLGAVTRAPWPRGAINREELWSFVGSSLLPWLERVVVSKERETTRRFSDERLAAVDEAWLRNLVRERGSLVFEGAGVQMQIRLLRLLKAYGYDSVTELVAEVRAAEFGIMHEEIIDRLTDLPTGFFRPWGLYDTLRTTLLPELIAARADERRLSFWSMECGTGQSAYSLALVLRSLGNLEGWAFHHLATDASAARVQRTKAGIYDVLEVARGLHDEDRKRFTRTGAGYQIDPELRADLDCRVLGVTDTWPPLPQFDVISVGRPLSSFVPEVREELLRRLAERLRPGGLLLLDQGDGVWGRHQGFRSQRLAEATVHRLAA